MLRRLFALSVFILVLLMSGQSRGQVFEYVGSTLWSGVKDVSVVNNYAYCAMPNGLLIYDVSDPENPEIRGYYYDYNGGSRALDVVGDFAYIASGSIGLVIFDVSDPSNPLYVGSYDTPDSAVDVAVSSNAAEKYAYVADIGSLQVINITDPANPVYAGGYSAGWNAIEKIFIVDDYAYMAIENWVDNLHEFLEIVDISDPTTPHYVGRYDNYNIGIQDIYVKEGYAYIANSWYEYPMGSYHGLLILDVSDPANPTFVTREAIDHPTTSIVVSGNYAYLTEFLNLIIYDISIPSDPNPVGYCSCVHNYSIASFMFDNILYTADGGLNSIDVSNPSSPTILSSVAGGETHGLAIQAQLAYKVGWAPGFQILDISNPILPELKGSFEMQYLAGNVCVDDIYAYVPNGSDGVKIIDIANALGPVLVGVYDNPNGGARQVFVYENVLYVGIDNSGIDIVDISNPANPVLVGQSPIPSDAIRGIDVDGIYLYALASYPLNKMYIFDISDPLHPIAKGMYDIEQPNGVFATGGIAYIVNNAGLEILDVSDPSDISLIGGYATPDNATRVYVIGNMAVVSIYQSGLLALDVSDPADISLLQSIDTPGKAYDIAVSNDHIFLADVYSLMIFRILQSGIAYPDDDIPQDFALYPNSPNPFNASTSIHYAIPHQANVRLDIFDLMGRKVETIHQGLKPAGDYSIQWNADRYSSGVYFYKLTAGEYSQARKCTLLK